MSAAGPEYPLDPTPSIEEITAAYAEILDHNSHHTGLGTGIGNMMKAMVEVQSADPGGPDDDLRGPVTENVERTVTESEMQSELHGIFHGDVFMRAGIRVAPIGQILSDSEDNPITSKELSPLIENTALFSEFLSKLHPEDIKIESAEQLLGDVVQSLSKTVSLCFSPDKHEDLTVDQKAALAEAGQDALRTFAVIDPEFARLGLNGSAMRKRTEDISPALSEYLDSATGGVVPPELVNEYRKNRENLAKMQTYEGMSNRVEYWGRNLLPEFLIAQKGQYLTDPKEQGYGPASWHKDGGQSRWNEALNFVMSLEAEERTLPFAAEVKDGLIVSVDAALAEIADETSPYLEYFKHHKVDLENLRAALSGEDYITEKLEKYVTLPDHLS